MLEEEKDMEIVGDCSSVEEALLQVETLSPNIVLTDIEMSGIDGIEATRRLCQKGTPPVIILTLHEDCLAEALEAGAVGYLLKDIKCQELVQAVRRVYHGELVIDERLMSPPQVEEGESEYLPPGGSGSGTLVKDAELIIPPPVDAAWLLRFVYQVEETLGATIVQQVGAWDKGTAITILLRRVTPLMDILDKLEKMTEVEKVEKEPLARSAFSGYSKKLWLLPRSSINLNKRIRVTLKETSMDKQELVTVPD